MVRGASMVNPCPLELPEWVLDPVGLLWAAELGKCASFCVTACTKQETQDLQSPAVPWHLACPQSLLYCSQVEEGITEQS